MYRVLRTHPAIHVISTALLYELLIETEVKLCKMVVRESFFIHLVAAFVALVFPASQALAFVGVRYHHERRLSSTIRFSSNNDIDDTKRRIEESM